VIAYTVLDPTNFKAITKNHLSLMSFLYISKSTRSSSHVHNSAGSTENNSGTCRYKMMYLGRDLNWVHHQ